MDVIRPAGLNERRCISRDVLGYYGSIVVCADYVSTSSSTEPLPLDDIVKALKETIIQHPVLCTVIKDAETEKPLLAKVSSMNLDEHLRVLDQAGRTEAESLQDLLAVVQNERLPDLATTPSWRLYVIPVSSANAALAPAAFCAAFSYSHALADGTSGALFHTTFLRALRNQDMELDSKREWSLPATEEPMGALEQIAELPISWSFLLRPLLDEYLPTILPYLPTMVINALGISLAKPVNLWTGARARPPPPSQGKLIETAVRVRRIPPATVEKVLEACRSHNVRLTGLLNFLTARVLARALFAESLTSFATQTAIDLRRCIPAAKESMGNFPSTVSSSLTIPPSAHSASDVEGPRKLTDEHWGKVQHLTELASQASSSLADQPVALLKYLTSIGQWTVKQAEKPSDSSFEVSNMGVFRDPDKGADDAHKWSITDMAFSQSASALGPPLTLNVASAESGSLALVVTWWPGMLGVDNEESFVDELCAGLEAELEGLS